jgi:hypothetical protein
VLPIGEDVEGNDMTWDEFFKDLMNGKFDKLDGDAIFALKSVDRLGPSDEVVIAFQKAQGGFTTYFVTRLIAERIALDQIQVFDIWRAVVYSPGSNNTSDGDRILVAYDIDIRTRKKYLESCTGGWISETYLQYFYQRIHGSMRGYYAGWKPKEVEMIIKEQEERRQKPLQKNNQLQTQAKNARVADASNIGKVINDKLAWNEWIRKPFINWLYK